MNSSKKLEAPTSIKDKRILALPSERQKISGGLSA